MRARRGTYSTAESAIVAVVNHAVSTRRAAGVAGRCGLERVLLVGSVAVVGEVETLVVAISTSTIQYGKGRRGICVSFRLSKDDLPSRHSKDLLVSVRVTGAAVLSAESVVDGAVDLGRSVVGTAAVDRNTALTGLKRSSKGHSGDKSKESEREFHFEQQREGTRDKKANAEHRGRGAD